MDFDQNVVFEILSSRLSGRRFAFGPADGPRLTENLSFGPNGEIEGYSHTNEAYWDIGAEHFRILDCNGGVMWRPVSVSTDKDGLLTFLLIHPPSPQTHFILQELAQEPADTPPHPAGAYLGAPQTSAPQQRDAPHENPHHSGLSDPAYLFPSDLEVTPTIPSRVLMIGSCLTALYVEQFRTRHPETSFDYIPYNFVSILPEAPPCPAQDYDFQYIQIPLRSVLTDRVVQGMRFNDPEFARTIVDDACDVIDVMLDAAMRYNRQHGLLSFVSGFIVPQRSAAPSLRGIGGAGDLCGIVRQLNAHLARKIADYDNTYLMDVDAVASSIGKRFVLDDMVYFYAHGAVTYQDWDDFGAIPRNEPIPALHTLYPTRQADFVACIFRQVLCAWRTIGQVDQVKAVIFDLDNTLWRGQIAEHYRPDTRPWPRTDGWPLGVWECIHFLRARGILVAVCSKNDLALVQERWAEVVDPPFLALEDFACVKINWAPKTQNIAEICSEFHIKPKSVVFVDDNPVERAAVTATFADIRAIGGNPYLTRRILLWSAETQIAHISDESARREDMVRQQIRREESRTTMDRETFLATLGTTLSFLAITSTRQPEFSRVLELTNKTNQFNTTGKRWNFEEISQYISEGGTILAFFVTDRFTTYGLVGVLYLRAAEIVQYVMSCRVLGMEIEEFVIAQTVSLLRDMSETPTDITASLIETKDNTPCRDVYLRCGFRETQSQDSSRHFILPAQDVPRCPPHITKAEPEFS
ncbi:HAD-IIIC family phosphatase [Acetobacter sp. TBRC 12305]|uniref:HAD-IIIC family phosphatase n=1 Tax=Acetobacter garciniae TaxID=2817435 RepID=A0A939KQX7_9PROT|nr:HAD-IIIC family phosphatase [Acetobacter garciniae]MBO1325977.1 HAD-IIIC family phosphatase [Acetobacter garciniae]MBX0345877.1 HAD-IIIC family phosphatase [Acetobacter garciniae]